MTHPARWAALAAYRAAYAGLRPLIFRNSAQDAHARLGGLLRWLDARSDMLPLLGLTRALTQPLAPVEVGGVTLEAPLMLAAGLVKGDGFATEDDALAAVEGGRNVMPGWRGVPRLAGLVEFGSFTRWPRTGNAGTVVWRDVPTRSTQNRIGLRNPGVRAAAAFLGARRDALPRQFGINLAVSPGVSDPDQQTAEVLESLAILLGSALTPTWFTLNLSCPNTEDDPRGHQTAGDARQLCGAAVAALAGAAAQIGRTIPLWVKLGPDLSDAQYRALVEVFAATGVRAAIATNTLGQPAPDDPALTAGIGGGRLHARAVRVTGLLAEAIRAAGVPLDVIGCGGVLDGPTYDDFARAGARAAQYWSALIYRGPLAAAVIDAEARQKP